MSIEPNGPADGVVATAAADEQSCPFRGPEPFAEEDAERFFGRQDEV